MKTYHYQLGQLTIFAVLIYSMEAARDSPKR